MGQISYQCKLPALCGNLLRFANIPAWNLLTELNFPVYYNRVCVEVEGWHVWKGMQSQLQDDIYESGHQ